MTRWRRTSIMSQTMRWTTSRWILNSSRDVSMALLPLVPKTVLREQLDDQVEENEHKEPDYEVDYESVDIELFSRLPKTVLREQLDDQVEENEHKEPDYEVDYESVEENEHNEPYEVDSVGGYCSSRDVSMALLPLVPKTVLREQLDDQVEENEHKEPDYEVDYESVDIEFSRDVSIALLRLVPKTVLREQLDDQV
ncbi:hypothetical protein J6590_058976 [Homalodisca vitripennis]|nr:hypothetical protein J6590_058976 [Homalodisca vitripennis]